MEKTTSTSQAKPSPVKIIVRGDTSVSIFEDHKTSKNGKPYTDYSFSSPQRRWIGSDGESQYSRTLYSQQLLDASETLVGAYQWVEEKRAELRDLAKREADKAANKES